MWLKRFALYIPYMGTESIVVVHSPDPAYAPHLFWKDRLNGQDVFLSKLVKLDQFERFLNATKYDCVYQPPPIWRDLAYVSHPMDATEYARWLHPKAGVCWEDWYEYPQGLRP